MGNICTGGRTAVICVDISSLLPEIGSDTAPQGLAAEGQIVNVHWLPDGVMELEEGMETENTPEPFIVPVNWVVVSGDPFHK